MSFPEHPKSSNQNTIAEPRSLDFTISSLHNTVRCVEIGGQLLEFKTNIVLKKLINQRKILYTVSEEVDKLSRTIDKLNQKVDGLAERAEEQQQEQQRMNEKLDLILSMVQAMGQSPPPADENLAEPSSRKRKTEAGHALELVAKRRREASPNNPGP